jgi:peptide deformylase
MAIRDILKMGDPRLLRIAQPVTEFGTPALEQLIADMFETMRAVNGAGLAAPQIGEDL